VSLRSRFRRWKARGRVEDELADEIRLHQEMLAEQFVREGMPPGEARAAAARQFGNATFTAEESREQWSLGWLSAAFKDLRFAARLARKQPLLTAAAVLTIAFGVGANTAIVSMLETVLLNPIGLRDAARVVVVRENLEKLHLHHIQTSAVEFREIREMTDAFSAAAAAEGHLWTAQIGGTPARLLGQAVTPGFFRVFSVNPVAGRFFTAEDRESVVLSYPFWRSQFGGDASVVGRALLLDDKPYRIVGVAPENFHLWPALQVWTPLTLSTERLNRRGYAMSLWLFARLRDGVSLPQAADRVHAYVRGIKAAPSGREMADFGYDIDVDPLAYFVAGDLRRPLWLLLAAALVVLLTGCANVAGLLLTRAAGRRREIAVRISLGAAGSQIVRQLLMESLVLAGLGGAAGIAMAAAILPVVTKLTVPGSQWLSLVALDRPMLIFGFTLALLSGLIFGSAPAVQLLRESHAAAMVRAPRRWFQDLFAGAEVAGAFVLVVMTALLLRSLWAVENIQTGFDPSHLTTAYLVKPKNDPGFLERMRAEMAASPGVESVALAVPVPFSGGGFTSGFNIRNRQHQAGEPEWHGEAYMISPGYLRTMRIPLLRGRDVTESDIEHAPLICLIDNRLADRFFPGQDPLGQIIEMYGGGARIVGVTGSIRGTTLDEDPRPVVYYPLAQVPFFPHAAAVVRSDAPAGAAIREAARRANPTVPLYDAKSMEERIGLSLGLRRVLANLLAVFGAISLLLATLGLYGVVAQVVAERTNEIGIRMALGARPGQILAQFARQGLRTAAFGLAAGLAIAIWAKQWVAAMLYQVRPFDVATFAASAAIVLALLAISVWWPARRASKIDPQRALHYE
jgi:putative ABC transport system permease protein